MLMSDGRPVPPNASLYIFDFCGTLFRGNTTLAFLRFVHQRVGVGRRLCWVLGCIVAGVARRLGVVGPEGHMRLRVRGLRGFSEDELREYARSFAGQLLGGERKDTVFGLFEQAVASGHRVVIASYTLDLIAEAVAAQYPGVSVVASALEFTSDRRCTGRYARQLQTIGKRAALEDLHGEAAIRNACFVTDNAAADADLLQVVRYPVLISAGDAGGAA